MRLITAECTECGNQQEDLVKQTSAPEFEPCEKCGCVHMKEVVGEIRASSAMSQPNSGAGPWG